VKGEEEEVLSEKGEGSESKEGKNKKKGKRNDLPFLLVVGNSDGFFAV